MSNSTSQEPSPAAGPDLSTKDPKQPEKDEVKFNFPLTEVPPNPLGEGRYIRSAAALIIGDEILNGKTLDRNSNYFARYCFEYGIDLRRIEVIPDEEDEIIEASRRLVKTYDFVITSGGIGPTHDDITYASLAKAFNQGLVHHQETLRRMAEMSKHRWASLAQQNEEQRIARERMALFPDKAEVLFVQPEIWVPVVRLEGKLCVFPGIPKLFQTMLQGLTPYLPLPPPEVRPFRQQIFTSYAPSSSSPSTPHHNNNNNNTTSNRQPESSIAPYLTDLQARTKAQGIRIGSYPSFGIGVHVSIIGRDTELVNKLAQEVVQKLDGRLVSEEEARAILQEKEKGAA